MMLISSSLTAPLYFRLYTRKNTFRCSRFRMSMVSESFDDTFEMSIWNRCVNATPIGA